MAAATGKGRPGSPRKVAKLMAVLLSRISNGVPLEPLRRRRVASGCARFAGVADQRKSPGEAAREVRGRPVAIPVRRKRRIAPRRPSGFGDAVRVCRWSTGLLAWRRRSQGGGVDLRRMASVG